MGVFEGLFIIEPAFADVDLGHGFDGAEDIPLCVSDESYKSDGGGIFCAEGESITEAKKIDKK